MDDPRKPRLLDQVRERCRVKHYSIRTEKTYADWIRRFILFHGKRPPSRHGSPRGGGLPLSPGGRRQRSRHGPNQAVAVILLRMCPPPSSPLLYIHVPAGRARRVTVRRWARRSAR